MTEAAVAAVRAAPATLLFQAPVTPTLIRPPHLCAQLLPPVTLPFIRFAEEQTQAKQIAHEQFEE